MMDIINKLHITQNIIVNSDENIALFVHKPTKLDKLPIINPKIILVSSCI
jgi:hypothetical protein